MNAQNHISTVVAQHEQGRGKLLFAGQRKRKSATSTIIYDPGFEECLQEYG